MTTFFFFSFLTGRFNSASNKKIKKKEEVDNLIPIHLKKDKQQ